MTVEYLFALSVLEGGQAAPDTSEQLTAALVARAVEALTEAHLDAQLVFEALIDIAMARTIEGYTHNDY